MTTARNSGLRADPHGFLIGQRRLEQGMATVHQDTQSILSILMGDMQAREVRETQQSTTLVRSLNRMTDVLSRLPQVVDHGRVTRTVTPTIEMGRSEQSTRTTTITVPVPPQPPVVSPLPMPDLEPDSPIPRSNADATPSPLPRITPIADDHPLPVIVTDQVAPTQHRRDERGRFVSDAGTPTIDVIPTPQPTPSTPSERARGADGRFGGGEGGDPKDRGILAGLKGLFSDMRNDLRVEADHVDPTVEAVKELGSMLSPLRKVGGLMMRGGAWLFKRRKKRDEQVPREQQQHNQRQEKLLTRLLRAMRGQGGGFGLGGGNVGGGGLLKAGLGGLAAVIAAAVAVELAKELKKLGLGLDQSRPPEQGDINPDGSSNTGVVGWINRKSKAITNGVRGMANSINGWFGGSNDYWDDGLSADSTTRVGMKTDPINQVGGDVDAPDAPRGGKPQKSQIPKNANNYDQMMVEEYSKLGYTPDGMAMLKAQVHTESNFNPLAVSPVGAGGMTQFMPATAKRFGVKFGDSPEAIRSQFAGQGKYMRFLLDRYKGDWDKAKAGYNAGEGNVDKAIARARQSGGSWQDHLPKKSETLPYIDKINSRAALYAGLGQGGAQALQQAPAKSPTVSAPVAAKSPVPAVAKAQKTVSQTIAPSPKPVPPKPIPAPPKVQQRESSPAPQVVQIANAPDTIAQNLSDRALAHAVTGGIGELRAYG